MLWLLLVRWIPPDLVEPVVNFTSNVVIRPAEVLIVVIRASGDFPEMYHIRAMQSMATSEIRVMVCDNNCFILVVLFVNMLADKNSEISGQ